MRLRPPITMALAATMMSTALTTIVLLPAAAASAGSATMTLSPTADSYVQQSAATTNYGDASTLVADALPARRTFIAFTVTGLSGSVTSVHLRLHATTENAGSDTGGTVKTVSSNTWSEAGITWNNQPDIDGPTVGVLGEIEANTWYDLDVTGVVTTNGTVGFAITSSAADGAYYDSTESGDNGPRLVITTTSTVTDPVLVGAGDIALCGSSGSTTTASLLDGIAGTVFTAGDNVQLVGASAEYTNCYQATWGRHTARTRPSPGNHDYYTGGSAYYDYFGTAAGEEGQGYYSYDLGGWHVVALNSNCSSIGGCQVGSAQEAWLRADLAASDKQCTVAYWHHPLFTSSGSTTAEVSPLFEALYDYGTEIVINGHVHNYERFAPQTPDGTLDAANGVREFVVGTGGYGHTSFSATIAANSQARNSDTLGVLKLTLKAGSYSWQFVPEDGMTYSDTGSETCHA